MGKRHYPPAYYRYREKHPAIVIRVTKEIFDKLKELQNKTGKTLAQLVRENLGIQMRNEQNAYRKGYEDAKKKYLVSYPCAVCGETIEVESPEEKAAIKKYMRQYEWGHQSCHEKT